MKRKQPPISGAQVRAARAFLGWTARALAKKADVPDFTLEWIEGHRQISGKDLNALAAIRAQLETGGIEFTDDEGIPGLRLHPRERGSKGRASPRRATLT
jgi:hypothetical protein